MVLGAIISAGASLAGGMLANKANKEIAQDQMDFQADMSNTAHQREVKDLIAAGLNPALSAMKGTGASTPLGAAPTMQDVVTPAVNSARTALEMENAKMQNVVLRTQAIKNDSDAALSASQAGKVNAETKQIIDASESTEFKNRAFKIGNRWLEPIEQLFSPSNSAKSVQDKLSGSLSKEDYRELLPPPDYKSTYKQRNK